MICFSTLYKVLWKGSSRILGVMFILWLFNLSYAFVYQMFGGWKYYYSTVISLADLTFYRYESPSGLLLLDHPIVFPSSIFWWSFVWTLNIDYWTMKWTDLWLEFVCIMLNRPWPITANTTTSLPFIYLRKQCTWKFHLF